MDTPKTNKIRYNSIINSKGITLIELIVVLALLGIVLSSILSFFSFNVGIFNRAQKKSDVQHDILMAAEFITRELRIATAVNIYKNIEPIPSNPNEGYIKLQDGYLEYGSIEHGIHRTHTHISKINFEILEKSDLLSFSIIGDEGGQKYTINTEVSLLNFTNSSDTIISGSSVHYLKQ